MNELILELETEQSLPESPYKGLIPYSEEDAPFFFGRENEQKIISSNLLTWRLTLLYGVSGVGKSSVLRAGVANQLRQTARIRLTQFGEPGIAVVTFSGWRDDPVVGLLNSVAQAVADAWDFPQSGGTTPAAMGLAEALQFWTERLEGDLLIILDQFEEYFMYHGQEDGPGTFAYEFARAVNRPDLRVNFLIAIREDALAKLDYFKGRLPTLFDNYLRLEHLGINAARAAIEKPLAEYNRRLKGGRWGEGADGSETELPLISIEPALVEAIIAQTKTGQVALKENKQAQEEAVKTNQLATNDVSRVETPYLQLVLSRLWDEEQRQSSKVLRLQTLEELGGAERIVRTHLDTVMGNLPPNEQDTAAQVFRYLVTPSGTKITYSVPDLSAYIGKSEPELMPVLNRLTGSDIRILRPVEPPLDQPGTARYEIFHDVLAEAILDWRDRYTAKQRQIEAERQAEAERQEQLRLARQRARQLRLAIGIIAVLVLFLAAAIVATIIAVNQSNEAERQTGIANTQKAEAERQSKIATDQKAEAERQAAIARQGQARGLAQNAINQLDVDPELALLLASNAVNTTLKANEPVVPQAGGALLQTLLKPSVRYTLKDFDAPVLTANYSPDGKILAAVIQGGELRLWQAQSGQLIIAIPKAVSGLVVPSFSPDSKYVLVGNIAPTKVYEAQTGKALYTNPGTLLDISPDSKTILVRQNNEDSSRLLDITNGQEIRRFPGAPISFSPDGKLILTIQNGQTGIISDATSGQRLVTLEGHTGRITAANFSRDNRYVVTASEDKSARTWEVASGKQLAIFQASNAVQNSNFSPDGKVVVSTPTGNNPVFWNALSGQVYPALTGVSRNLFAPSFSPDSKLVAAISSNNSIVLFEPQSGLLLNTLPFPNTNATQLRFSPNGNLLLANNGETSRLWATRSASLLATLPGGSRFSPDGNSLFTFESDSSLIRVWDIKPGAVVANLTGQQGLFSSDSSRLIIDNGRAGKIYETNSGKPKANLEGSPAALSPDGRLIFTILSDQTGRIYDARNGQELAKLTGYNNLSKVVFSPDNKFIVTAGAQGSTRLVEASNGQFVAFLEGQTNNLINLIFSPDSRFLFAQDGNGNTIRAWEIPSGRLVSPAPFSGPGFSKPAISPNSQLIAAVASGNRSVKIAKLGGGEPALDLGGHTDTITSISFSSDSQLVLTTSLDKTVRVWEAETGQPVATLSGHSSGVSRGAFSADGKYIYSETTGKNIKIWQVEGFKELATLNGSLASFSPNSQTLLYAAPDKTARLWDIATGKELFNLKGHTEVLSLASFSPDGKLVVTNAYNNPIRVWDATTGKLLISINGYNPFFSPDSQLIIVTSFERPFQLADPRSGKVLANLAGYNPVFSPDNNLMAVSNDSLTATLYDAKTGQPLATLQGHSGSINSNKFSADSKLLVTASEDGTAKIWNVPSGQLFNTLQGHTGPVYGANFSSDGKFLVTFSSDNSAKVWETASGKLIATLSGHTDRLFNASFSPDGKLILTASQDKTARLWNAMSGQLQATLTVKTDSGATDDNLVLNAEFSPGGQYIITSSLSTGYSQVWEVATGKELYSLSDSNSRVYRPVISRDGKTILAPDPKTVKLREIQSGKVLLTISHSSNFNSFQFSPDGKTFLAYSSDGSVNIWDSQTGNILAVLPGRDGALVAADYSPDGKLLVTASQNGQLLVYLSLSQATDLLQSANQRLSRSLTPQEQSQYGVSS